MYGIPWSLTSCTRRSRPRSSRLRISVYALLGPFFGRCLFAFHYFSPLISNVSVWLAIHAHAQISTGGMSSSRKMLFGTGVEPARIHAFASLRTNALFGADGFGVFGLREAPTSHSLDRGDVPPHVPY